MEQPDQRYFPEGYGSVLSASCVAFVGDRQGVQIRSRSSGDGCGVRWRISGIPLAILFPEVRFTLVDSIGKKIRVVDEVVRSLGLTQVETVHGRAEQVDTRFDYVVSRAVTEMTPFIGWIWNKLDSGDGAGTLPNGILYLKGGDLQTELATTGKRYKVFDIATFFEDPFFETKRVVYFPRNQKVVL